MKEVLDSIFFVAHMPLNLHAKNLLAPIPAVSPTQAEDSVPTSKPTSLGLLKRQWAIGFTGRTIPTIQTWCSRENRDIMTYAC